MMEQAAAHDRPPADRKWKVWRAAGVARVQWKAARGPSSPAAVLLQIPPLGAAPHQEVVGGLSVQS
jgi:hypothetical protein